jgi:hypothetical protein
VLAGVGASTTTQSDSTPRWAIGQAAPHKMSQSPHSLSFLAYRLKAPAVPSNRRLTLLNHDTDSAQIMDAPVRGMLITVTL